MDVHNALAGARLAFDKDETAQMLSISKSSLYQLTIRGQIRPVKILSRLVYPAAEVRRFLDERMAEAATAVPNPPPHGPRRGRGRPRKQVVAANVAL